MIKKKDIQELLDHQIITPQAAFSIAEFYRLKEGSKSNRLIIAFGILGALLVGLGIILILAHNWDQFSRITKVMLAITPLFIGQCLCAYVLYNDSMQVTWREGVSTFLFFAVGAVIALIGQIYNLPASERSFVLTWMLLIAPLIYIMNSKVVTIFFLIGITNYAQLSFADLSESTAYSISWYWLSVLIPLPMYWQLVRQSSDSLTVTLLNWLFPISICVGVGTFFDKDPGYMLVTYVSLMAIYFFISSQKELDHLPLFRNGYRVISTVGTIGILLPLTFSQSWEGLMQDFIPLVEALRTPEFRVAIIAVILAIGGLIWSWKKKQLELHPLNYLFLVFAMFFLMAWAGTSPRVLINLLVLLLGIFYIKLGSDKEHFGILNFGLIVITLLIICRFFDFEISYILRGLLFVAVGVGFFIANYWMYKRRLS